MSINNGVIADANHFNGAFLSRTVDSDTLGKIDLLNSSSSPITDVQATINDTITRVDTAEQDIISLENTRVFKATSSTDNAIPRFDGTTGQTLQNSGVTIDDLDNIFTPGDLEINGNLTVNGTLTSVNSATLDVTDANVTVNKGGSDITAQGAGLTVERTTVNGSMIYDSAAVSKWKAGNAGSEVEIATISGAQVITNKDIDGGTASNTSRITVPKASFSTLSALTRKAGTVVYATDTQKFYYDNGTNLIDTSGGATSAIDSSTGSASGGLIIKTAGDGFLDKTFNNTIPTFSSESNFVTFLGRSAIIGDRFFDTTTAALKIYDGTTWVASSGTSTLTTSSLLLENVGVACSVSANALTIALKQADGSTDATSLSPVRIGFRNNTVTSGAYDVRTVTGALSVTIPSGATLGLTTGSNAYIYVYAIDNGGTVALGVNSIWSPDFRNSTANLDAGSDTASTSGPYFVGGAAALSYRVIARLRYTTAPNGTYTAVPDEVYIGSSPSLMTANGINPGDFLSFTSGTKTSGASNNYLAMTTNSLTLQPGRWKISGSVGYGSSGNPAYTTLAQIWAAANGADNGTLPAALSTLAGLSVESPFVDPAGFATPNIFQTVASVSQGLLASPVLIVNVTSTSNIFLVPRPAMTTAANSRVTCTGSAERIK